MNSVYVKSFLGIVIFFSANLMYVLNPFFMHKSGHATRTQSCTEAVFLFQQDLRRHVARGSSDDVPGGFDAEAAAAEVRQLGHVRSAWVSEDSAINWCFVKRDSQF